jgi:competence protein ComEC
MDRYGWIIVYLAYIIGLLSAAAVEFLELNTIALVIISGSLSSIVVYLFGYLNHTRFNKFIYSLVLIVTVLAGFYFQFRIPEPLPNDISDRVLKTDNSLVIVTGKILSEPKLTASHKLQFLLKTISLEIDRTNIQSVSGKLYATIPLLQGTGIYPGAEIALKGTLYRPQPSNYPGEFDFRVYLARQGIFAGIKGKEVILQSKWGEPLWSWRQLRRRIVKTHLQALGSPVGQLVSSMVLGSKAVDLPIDIRDSFVQTGLAHVLAASGFQVSLLLGIVLKLSNPLASRSRLIIGLAVLLIYLGLTGLQPSIIRATLMDISILIAMLTESKVNSLGSLLLAATIILIFNPLWIRDVGFQLSFLATLGLIVTLPILQAKLSWLPPTISTLIAIPVAASIWVLPLLGYVFHLVAVYSLPINIVTTPLVTIIAVIGTMSSVLALIMPILGKIVALLLYYPVIWLIKIVEFAANLPGSTIEVGNISLTWLLAIYALFIAIWLSDWWQRRWSLVLMVGVILAIVTVSSNHLELAGTKQEVVVSQNSQLKLETRANNFSQSW